MAALHKGWKEGEQRPQGRRVSGGRQPRRGRARQGGTVRPGAAPSPRSWSCWESRCSPAQRDHQRDQDRGKRDLINFAGPADRDHDHRM